MDKKLIFNHIANPYSEKSVYNATISLKIGLLYADSVHIIDPSAMHRLFCLLVDSGFFNNHAPGIITHQELYDFVNREQFKLNPETWVINDDNPYLAAFPPNAAQQINEMNAVLNPYYILVNNALTSGLATLCTEFDITSVSLDFDLLIEKYVNLVLKELMVPNSFPVICDELIRDIFLLRDLDNEDNITTNRFKHPNVVQNILSNLPIIDAPIDELIDIKKELHNCIVRFRSCIASYSEQIQSMPWTNDFEINCHELYIKNIAPEVLNIAEQDKSNTFIKNLGKQIANEKDFWAGIGSIGISILSNSNWFTYMGALCAALFGTKMALQAYLNKCDMDKDIKQNNMYFYFEARKKFRNKP